MRTPNLAGFATIVLALSLPWGSVLADEPSIQQRDAIEDYLAPNFVLPATVQWQFAPTKPYLGDQILVCGEVNFQSAMRVYQGFHRFYAVLDGNRVKLSQIENKDVDGSGRLHAKLNLLCGGS